MQSLFLPYADQDRPPLDLRAICVEIERRLDGLSPDVERVDQSNKSGIRVSSGRVGSQRELWRAVEPVLPAGVFAEPRS